LRRNISPPGRQPQIDLIGRKRRGARLLKKDSAEQVKRLDTRSLPIQAVGSISLVVVHHPRVNAS